MTAGSVRVGYFDLACDVKYIVVLGCRHADDEVYAGAFHFAFAFFLIADLYEAWREAQAELCVFGEYLFVYSAIVFEHEGVVGIGYEEDVEDASLHQVYEGGVFELHGRMVCGSVCVRFVFVCKDTKKISHSVVLECDILYVKVLCVLRGRLVPSWPLLLS